MKEKSKDFTEYNYGDKGIFRIVKTGHSEFIIQKKFTDVKIHGMLWWRKSHQKEVWEKVDKNGRRFWFNEWHPELTNIHDFIFYKSETLARLAIEDIVTFPIIL